MRNGGQGRGPKTVPERLCVVFSAAEKIATIAMIVSVIAVIVMLVRLKITVGSENRTEITITSAEYDQGLEAWGQLDYAGAEQKLLSVLKEENRQRGEGSPEAALVSQKLGALYLDMGRCAESYDYLNSAYVTFRQKYGENDGNTVLTKCQIHRYDVAAGNYEQAFAGFQEAFQQTGYWPYKVQICQMTAQCYLSIGNYQAAAERYAALKDYYEKLIGLDNAPAVNWLNDCGVLLTEMGQYSGAEQDFALAEQHWKAYAKEEDATLANLCINWAACCAGTGSGERAAALGERALAIDRRLFGEDSVQTARALDQLAGAYGELQMPDKQKDCLTQALRIALDTVGENHEITAGIENDLGNDCYYRGRLDEAAEHYEKALEIRRNILGKASISTASVCQNLSSVETLRGRHAEAVRYGDEALAIYDGLFGADNLRTAGAQLSAARVHADAGDKAEAERLAAQGYQTCEKLAEQDSLDMAFARLNRGYVTMRLGQPRQAESQLAAAAHLFAQWQGKEHTNTANAQYYLGVACFQAGDNQAALSAFTRAAAIYQKLHAGDAGYLSNVETFFRDLYDRLQPDEPYDEWRAGLLPPA